MPCRGESGHDPRPERSVGVGQARERLFEHADEERIDAAHDEHAAVGQAGAGEERSIAELASNLCGLRA